jgi:hypothetical protein
MKNLTVKQYIETYRDNLALTTEEKFFAKSIIMVVEVPHQRKATSLYYYDANDYDRLYLASVEEDADKGGGIECTPENRIEKIEEYAGSDLHNWRKLVGVDEILLFVPVDHQRLEVLRSITNNLLALGVAEEIEG